MTDELTADEIRTLLKLEPNATCGFVRVTFVSKHSIAAGGLPAPFAEGRPLGSALYFMVTPCAPLRPHRIRNEQLNHYYLGDPLQVCGHLLHVEECDWIDRTKVILEQGTTTVFEPVDREAGFARFAGWSVGELLSRFAATRQSNLDELAGIYPSVAADLRAIAASVQHVVPSGGPR